MNDIQFVLTFSIFPLSGLLLAATVYWLTRHDGRPAKPRDRRSDRP